MKEEPAEAAGARERARRRPRRCGGRSGKGSGSCDLRRHRPRIPQDIVDTSSPPDRLVVVRWIECQPEDQLARSGVKHRMSRWATSSLIDLPLLDERALDWPAGHRSSRLG